MLPVKGMRMRYEVWVAERDPVLWSQGWCFFVSDLVPVTFLPALQDSDPEMVGFIPTPG